MVRVLGTSGNDNGSVGFPTLKVSGDNSLVRGFAGFDTIVLGAGIGIDVFGGQDVDILGFSGPAALGGVTVDLINGFANRGSVTTATLVSIESVNGTNAADILIGDGRRNTLDGGDGADTLFGNGGVDIMRAGVDSADDRLFGGAGNDIIAIGQNSNFAPAGVDIAWGGPGDDSFLLSGGESCRAHGQDGADTFTWNFAARGRSVICDFEDGVDRLEILGSVVTPEDILARAVQVGGNVVINAAGLGNLDPDQPRVLVIHSFNLADLSVDDFVL